MWKKTSFLAIAVMLLAALPLKAVQAASEAPAESESMGLFAIVLAIFSFATLALMTFYAVRDNN